MVDEEPSNEADGPDPSSPVATNVSAMTVSDVTLSRTVASKHASVTVGIMARATRLWQHDKPAGRVFLLSFSQNPLKVLQADHPGLRFSLSAKPTQVICRGSV